MENHISTSEENRLLAIRPYHLLDMSHDEQLDELTKLAAKLFNVPMVVVTILDKDRQWFKSHYGMKVRKTPRNIAFCHYTVTENRVFEVQDTLLDERFSNNPLVLEDPNIRFYCGAPLVNRKGLILGSLGVIDRKSRYLSENERMALKLLAKQVVDHFELNREKIELENQKARLEEIVLERTNEIKIKLNELEDQDNKLVELNHELNTFIYKASHDLRGPLKTLIGLTGLTLKELKDENVRPYLELLSNTEIKLDNTLNSLLKVTEIKNINLKKDLIDIAKLVKDCFNHVEKTYANKNPFFECQIETNKKLYTDKELLELILIQVLNNSVYFNFKKLNSVKVRVYDEEKTMSIEVKDNASGISDEEKDRVFEMFFKNRSTGSGLGLYIAKCAVEKLGGTITFTSERNIGSTFIIKLPV